MHPQQIAFDLMLNRPTDPDEHRLYLEFAVDVLMERQNQLTKPITDFPFYSKGYLFASDGISAYGVYIGPSDEFQDDPRYGQTYDLFVKTLLSDCRSVNGLRTEQDCSELGLSPDRVVSAIEFAERFGVSEEKLLCQVGRKHTVINCWPGLVVTAQVVYELTENAK